MSDREIKREIMNRLGLDPNNATDNKTYKRLYDVQRLRTVNYSRQQFLETPIRTNENWLQTLRRQQSEAPLTAQQEGILRTSSQNAAEYAARIERGDQAITQQGILNLELQFQGLLTKNTLGLEKQYDEFRTYERTIQYLTNSDGNIIAIYELSAGETPPATLPAGTILEPPYTQRITRTDQTVQEVKEFLETLADALHTYQDQKLAGNRALYRGSKNIQRKRVGS